MNAHDTARSLRADPDAAVRYRAAGWWGDRTLSDHVAALAADRPDAPAWITPDGRYSWRQYDRAAARIAGLIAAHGLPHGARVAVLLPDGPAVHAALLGVERAGTVAVGIGARAGLAEIAHLLKRTGATLLIAHERMRERALDELLVALRADGAPVESVLAVPDLIADPAWCDAPPPAHPALPAGDPDALFLINSTSGTTGMPKCVMHTQNRWFYFHRLAAEAGRLGADEVFMGAVPMPFGFGLWTSHFSPAVLGCPTVVLPKFDAGTALDLIERERVTVLCCVSTQFIMLLNEQAERPRDLSSLRAMFTGGEAVPYRRAAEFEEVTGAAVLQFYGSNETGALSRTTADDTRERRLTTAGRLIPEMEVRLFDPVTGDDVQGRGQPACRGPATCLGYWDDDAANAQLFTADGWMLMGDIVEVDADDYLRVVGRTSEFIIRGGKNLSAPAIEAEVATHPAVALCAAVPAPDPVFGERVCIYVTPRPNHALTLDAITQHLSARGVSREWFPERLVLMEELPRSSGGKVAKGVLTEDARQRWAMPA
ncbi:class I adenylate-forming enzyme family protein [Sphingomonas jatrophae]|uniref:Acyl-CoA synthetase n=1 Tax=Sphingomonas jatrophae TaxID=1166337 RepID=A0A1I6M4Z7_9SPHN|nr:class I adenylate-forming enzyme family protein [Sphingomonas jatrophae]SFS10795.1 acyl-CoA synthetase [Sphingomonas jatrophae]